MEGINGQFHHCTKANVFNDFFSSVFVDEDPNAVPTFTTDRDDLHLLSCVKVIPTIVFDKLYSLKSDKSPGPDGWPPIILRNCAEHLCVSLAINPLKVDCCLMIGRLGTSHQFLRGEIKLKLITTVQCT